MHTHDQRKGLKTAFAWDGNKGSDVIGEREVSVTEAEVQYSSGLIWHIKDIDARDYQTLLRGRMIGWWLF